MKFDIGPSLSQSGSILSAKPDDGSDGVPPISGLHIDTVFQNLSPARQAIAGCLAFEDYVGQEVLLSKPIPRMAQVAILDFFGVRKVFAHPVTDVPSKVWPSSGSLLISTYGSRQDDRGFYSGPSHNYSLELADGTLYNGVISSPHRAVLATNALFMAGIEDARFSLTGLQLAIGVLLSEDLHMRNLHICAQLEREEFTRYRALLRSVELNLTSDGVF